MTPEQKAELLNKVTQLKEIAESTIHSVCKEYEDTREELLRGVTLPIAHRIIDELWGKTPEGMRVKTQLYDQFPVENGRVILRSELTKVASARMRSLLEPVEGYLNTVIMAIEELVGTHVDYLKTKSLTDETVLLEYNEIRKETLRYIAFCDYAYYDVCPTLLSERVRSWGDVVYDPSGVENGDYLFLDCFKEKLKTIHQHSVAFTALMPQGDYYNGNLGGFSWRHSQIEDYIKLTFLFFNYLMTRQM